MPRRKRTRSWTLKSSSPRSVFSSGTRKTFRTYGRGRGRWQMAVTAPCQAPPHQHSWRSSRARRPSQTPTRNVAHSRRPGAWAEKNAAHGCFNEPDLPARRL